MKNLLRILPLSLLAASGCVFKQLDFEGINERLTKETEVIARVVNRPETPSTTPLIDALDARQWEKAKTLLKEGSSPDQTDDQGRPALLAAAGVTEAATGPEGEFSPAPESVLRLMLEKGADRGAALKALDSKLSDCAKKEICSEKRAAVYRRAREFLGRLGPG